jgi:hypothetical protein
MKIFLISQTKRRGYDTYDSAVVCALDGEDAITIHPNGGENEEYHHPFSTWAPPKDVDVEYLGEAGSNVERGVICASFNAG